MKVLHGVFFAAGVLVGCSHPTGADWPMYQLRPDHNAVLATPKLTARWRLALHAKINGGLAYANDTLYLDTFGREVIAIEARDGKVAWRRAFDNIIMSTPILAAGNVIVGTGRNGPMKDAMGIYRAGEIVHQWGRGEGDSVVALSADGGKDAWSFKTVGEDMPSGAALRASSFLGTATCTRMRSISGADIRIGASICPASLRWRRRTSRTVGRWSRLARCIITCVTPWRSISIKARLRGLRRTAIRILRRPSGMGSCISAASRGETASIPAASSTLFAVDAKTGDLRWQYRMKACGDFTAAVSHERAITGTFSDGVYYQASATENAVYAFDGATGAVRFRVPTLGRVKMSVVVQGGIFFFGDTAGNVYAIDVKSGAIKKQAHFNERFTTSPPIIVGSTLFLATERSLLALSPQTLAL